MGNPRPTFLLALFLLLLPPAAAPLPFRGPFRDALAQEEAEKAPDKGPEEGLAVTAQRIIGRLDSLPLAGVWDSVARLEKLGKDAVPAIRKAVEGAGEKAQLGAAKALLALGDDGVRQEALQGIAVLAKKGADREVRVAAIEMLGSEDPENSPELLREILDGSDGAPDVLIPAARILWEQSQDTRARGKLVNLLESRDRGVRASAALALAEIDYFDGPVREALRELREEPSTRGRLAASILRGDALARREERKLDSGESVLPGVDRDQLMKVLRGQVRELEARLEGVTRSRGGTKGGDPLLDEIIELIQENYIEETKTRRQELIRDAIKGMVRSLDPNSSYMDVEETKRFSTQFKGEYLGVGARVEKLNDDGPLEVMKPIYGGSAYKCGIRTGDRILEVDGIPTFERKLEEIIDNLKGPEGTTVKLKVMRRGWTEPRDFEVTRQVISVPSVLSEMLPGSIGYIRLFLFGDHAAEEFERALDELEKAGLEGLIFDLRHNTGGKLDQAVKIVDLFVGEKEQPIVTQKGRDGLPVISTPATAGQRPNYPIAILVNGQSASASEVVSGALQDYHRATLVGKRTFGKGSVQTLYRLSPKARDIEGGEAQLRITVQYYHLPSGRCIHTVRDEEGRVAPGKEGGVEPDIEVEMEHFPAWLSEEVEKIRSSQKVQDYLDAHQAAVRTLGLDGDGREVARWPEFDAFIRSLDTHATPDHVRQVVRYHLRRRIEDERGKEFPSDFQEDEQLQRGIVEMLSKLGKRASELKPYVWLEGKKFKTGRENGAGSKETKK